LILNLPEDFPKAGCQLQRFLTTIQSAKPDNMGSSG
jgi:hypothetical protein